jgi:NAD(P)-dependent dehydrogenase (short-subunit alcohol dehydrogenase family)
MLLRSILVDSAQRGTEAPLLRIVSVASGTHDPAKKTGMPHPRYIKADWLAHPERDAEDTKKDGRCTYTYIHHHRTHSPHTTNNRTHGHFTHRTHNKNRTSKLCNVLFTYELARRLKACGWEDRVHVTAYDPGFMPGTGLARDYPAALRWIFVNALPWASVFLSRMETPERSGAQLARLATDPAFAERTNQYFVPSLQDIASSEESYDEAKQADLWATSIQLAQLTAEETPFGETDKNWMKGH